MATRTGESKRRLSSAAAGNHSDTPLTFRCATTTTNALAPPFLAPFSSTLPNSPCTLLFSAPLLFPPVSTCSSPHPPLPFRFRASGSADASGSGSCSCLLLLSLSSASAPLIRPSTPATLFVLCTWPSPHLCVVCFDLACSSIAWLNSACSCSNPAYRDIGPHPASSASTLRSPLSALRPPNHLAKEGQTHITCEPTSCLVEHPLHVACLQLHRRHHNVQAWPPS
jgi:hypothetical protein